MTSLPQSDRLRDRSALAALAAIAVLVVLAAVLVLARMVTGDEATAGAAGPLKDAPSGTRWVGMDGVVVAVPDWWTTGETQCGAPVEDTVYFDPAAVHDCADPADPATVREVSALGVLDGTCCQGELEIRSMVEVDGSRAIERPGCEEWFRGVCRRLLTLPGTGVVFAVTIAEEGDGSYEAIRDSARLLPDGLTTVPLRVGDGFTPGRGTEPSLVDDTLRAIGKAGLQVEVEESRPGVGREAGMQSNLPHGSLLGIEPSPGSVVEDGARVTVTVMG